MLLTQKYPVHFGHLEGIKHYPQNGPHIELMVDEEYILNKKIKQFKFENIPKYNNMIKFKYVILYVENVESSMNFYKNTFNAEIKFITLIKIMEN